MRAIVSFFRNLFKDRQISRNEILAFAAHQLAAMIEENPEGLLDERITETTTALNAMQAVTGDEGGKLAIQKVRTQAKKAFRLGLPAVMAKYYGLVLGQFGAGSLVLTECFPKGRSIFKDCREEQLAGELQTLAEGLSHHADVLPAAALAAAAALVTTWEGLRGTQTAALMAHQAHASDINAAQMGLARALYRNVLWIAYHFVEDEAKCEFYCPQRYLENRAGSVTPGVTTLALQTFDQQTGQVVLTITADGAESFRVLRCIQGEADFTVVAEGIKAANGTRSFTETLSAAGIYEYVAEAVNGTRTGERSGIVRVQKA